MFRRFGFILAATLIAAGPAAAQDERPVQLTIGGGWTGVYGAASNHIGSGGNFTIGVLFNTHSAVKYQAEYGWNGMKKKQLVLDVYAAPVQQNGTPTNFYADANMQYGVGNVIFEPKTSGRASPYGLVGAGIYYRPVTITTPGVGYTTICDPYWYVCYPTLVSVDQVVGSRSSTDFGMNFGGGLNFKMTEHTSFYFEVRYHYVWGPTISNTQVNPLATAPTTLKANGQFLPITFGFRF
jgi:opacity protein-like surface antigen